MKTKTLLTAIMMIGTMTAYCQIIHIPADYPAIQEGIEAANNGDTVLVEQGTYFENINFLGKAITVASHYLIEQDSAHIYNTIINGSQPANPDIGTVVTFDSDTDTTSCLFGFTITAGTGTKVPYFFPNNSGGGIVFFSAGGKLESNIIENNTCILDTLDGFIFGGGIGSGPPLEDHLIFIKDNIIRNNVAWTKGASSSWNMGWANGGGIYLCYNAIVEGNLIESNICQSDNSISAGGAIRMIADPMDTVFQILVEVRDNLIRNNESISETFGAFAGGISCSAANTIIENNTITGNSVESQNYCMGAGLYFDLINTYYAKVNNNYISNNISISGSSDGGAIGLFRSIDIEICNNVIENNSADIGGAFSVNASQPLLISNNTILNNEANEEGGAFYIYDDSEVQVYNSIMRNDVAAGLPNEIEVQNGSSFSIQYSNIEGAWPGTGNIDLDPLFTGTGDFPYSLQDESPCVNTGIPNTTGLNLPELDLAGNPRLYGGRIEMGAYENQNVIVGLDRNAIQNNFELVANPNPFANQTTIELSLHNAVNVTLSVYDITGKRLETFLLEELKKGDIEIKWNANELSKGLYFIRLKTKNQTITKKVILLR